MSVALLGNPQNPAHGWGKTVRQSRHQPEIDDPEPAVLHELEVAWMGVGMQQADHARPSEEESHVLQGSCVAFVVREICG